MMQLNHSSELQEKLENAVIMLTMNIGGVKNAFYHNENYGVCMFCSVHPHLGKEFKQQKLISEEIKSTQTGTKFLGEKKKIKKSQLHK